MTYIRQLKKVVSLNNILESMGLLKYKKKDILAKFKRIIGKTHLLRIFGKRKDFRRMDVEELVSGIDWKASKAYYFGTTAGTIYINLKGREPYGIVDSCEYDALCAEIIHGLKKIKDPQTGYNIVDNVYRKEDLFEGEYQEKAPDLIVTFRDGYGIKIKKDDRFSKRGVITDT